MYGLQQRFQLFIHNDSATFYNCPTDRCNKLQYYIHTSNFQKNSNWSSLLYLFERYYKDVNQEHQKIQRTFESRRVNQSFLDNRKKKYQDDDFPLKQYQHFFLLPQLDNLFEYILNNLNDQEKINIFFNIFEHFKNKIQILLDDYLHYCKDWNRWIATILEIKQLKFLYRHDLYQSYNKLHSNKNFFLKDNYFDIFRNAFCLLNKEIESVANKIEKTAQSIKKALMKSQEVKNIIDVLNELPENKDYNELASKNIKLIKELQDNIRILNIFSRSSVKIYFEIIYDKFLKFDHEMIENYKPKNWKIIKNNFENYIRKNLLEVIKNCNQKNSEIDTYKIKLENYIILFDKCLETINKIHSSLSNEIKKAIYFSKKNQNNLSKLLTLFYMEIINSINPIKSKIFNKQNEIKNTKINLNKIKNQTLEKINLYLRDCNKVKINSFLNKIQIIQKPSEQKKKKIKLIFSITNKEFYGKNAENNFNNKFSLNYYHKMNQIILKHKKELLNMYEHTVNKIFLSCFQENNKCQRLIEFKEISLTEQYKFIDSQKEISKHFHDNLNLSRYNQDNILDKNMLNIFILPMTDREKTYILYALTCELNIQLDNGNDNKSDEKLISFDDLFKKIFDDFQNKLIYSKEVHQKINKYIDSNKKHQSNKNQQVSEQINFRKKHSGFKLKNKKVNTSKTGYSFLHPDRKFNFHDRNKQQGRSQWYSILSNCWQVIVSFTRCLISLVLSFFSWTWGLIKNHFPNASVEINDCYESEMTQSHRS